MDVLKNIKNGTYENKFPYETQKANRVVWNAYQAEGLRLKLKLRTDLEEEFGYQDHPKRQDLFELAWVYGHSIANYRLEQIYSHYVNFSTLM